MPAVPGLIFLLIRTCHRWGSGAAQLGAGRNPVLFSIQCLRAGGARRRSSSCGGRNPGTSHAGIQRIRKVESPEVLAQPVFLDYELAAKGGPALPMFGVGCFLLGGS